MANSMRNWLIFDHFVHLSSPRISRSEKKSDFVTFFVYLSCLRNMTNAVWIAAETITKEEEEIIRDHLLMFASNFLRCDIDKCNLCERDALAGMDLLRTEIVPLFRQFVDADFNWIPFMCRLSHWEQKCKRRLLQGLSLGNTEMKCRNMPEIKAEVRPNQRWWDNDYKENDDSVHLLIDEYNLTD